jgi:hypothetical protein
MKAYTTCNHLSNRNEDKYEDEGVGKKGGGFVPVLFQLLQHLPPGLVDLHANVGQSRISDDRKPDSEIETSLPIRRLSWF